jgi:hypothetical protein
MCLIGYGWLPLLGLLLMAGMILLCVRRCRCRMVRHDERHSKPVTFATETPSVQGERP